MRWQRLTAGHRRTVRALLLAPAALCLALALGTPAPLQIRIAAAHSDPVRDVVTRLTLVVTNRTGAAVTPHFSIDATGQASAFWTRRAGPAAIGPGTTARVTLGAPGGGRGLGNGTPFLVQAVSDGPRTISTSPRFVQPGPVQTGW